MIRWSLESGNIISTDNITWFVLGYIKRRRSKIRRSYGSEKKTFVLNGNYLLCETFKWPIFRLDVALASTEKDLIEEVQRSADRMRHKPVLIILVCVKQRTIEFFSHELRNAFKWANVSWRIQLLLVLSWIPSIMSTVTISYLWSK